MNKSRFKLTKGSSLTQPYHFVLKAPNNETILNSENYTTKDAALNGIASVKVNSQSVKNFEIKTATNNEKYFILKAQNGQPIGTSETYSSEQMCKHGINAVMKYALNSETEE